MWGRPSNTFERWLTFLQSADPALIFLAEDEASGELAAICTTSVIDERGHIGGLRVRPAWRRQGLGLALLQHAFADFYRRGAREATLSVDAESPTRAPRLYRQAGMDVARSYVIYQKEVRPGVEWRE
jgi:ribosomal protein S18 acetylase RimI-like enzyme